MSFRRVGPPGLCRRALSTTPHLGRKSIYKKEYNVGENFMPKPKPGEERKPKPSRTVTTLEKAVEEAYIQIFMELKMSSLVNQHFRRREFDRRIHRVNAAIEDCFLLNKNRIGLRHHNPLYHRLLQAHNEARLVNDMRHLALSSILQDFVTPQMWASMVKLTDFTTPYDWYPATRTMHRTVHMHVGPTNSGKTYHALKALESAKTGVYSGPLRLLAVEVYERMLSKGRPCALVTGEEVRLPKDTDQYYVSSTVEMIPLNQRFDVAVIDEIQMISDKSRGFGWVSAVLGVQAKEVHLCGEERTVELIRKILATTGDELIVHRYSRLTPLKTAEVALGGSMNRVEKGDALVAFSRKTLISQRIDIEKATGRRCAIVYGTMPPEVRRQQAELFNRPDNDYDYIVASDAIGMGLNLAIKRVIFQKVEKFDGGAMRQLYSHEIKQIAGRAGRYRTSLPGATAPQDNCGWVTSLYVENLKPLKKLLEAPVEPITKAYVDAPVSIVERFASFYPPGTPLSFLLLQIQSLARLSPLYDLNVGHEQLRIANMLQDIPLSTADRMTFCYIPASLRFFGAAETLRAMAKVVASGQGGELLEMPEVPLEYLNDDGGDYGPDMDYQARLEQLHAVLNQYIWLSYRYTSLFPSQKLALHVRHLVAERMMETLKGDTYDKAANLRERQEKRELTRRQWQNSQGRDVKQRKRFFPDGKDPELGMPRTREEVEAELEARIEEEAMELEKERLSPEAERELAAMDLGEPIQWDEWDDEAEDEVAKVKEVELEEEEEDKAEDRQNKEKETVRSDDDDDADTAADKLLNDLEGDGEEIEKKMEELRDEAKRIREAPLRSRR
ncbi:hypothetical protein CDD80_4969 [Ophiocordyceps camponoti-rufipedis]|uniref:RNA helicase n=1 Tax=Ophiocordyceps camponoti-rufipedis TaxID=2004952 RepID=A0A2C5YW26_9HYPO|nr:hypothetical protein CDD80_4969 [Ophiocordyceps camponoti-rufipedis]